MDYNIKFILWVTAGVFDAIKCAIAVVQVGALTGSD